jgi:predicted 3-demethylubiquinone-9 3-methyltransferase (glyoxalase superfamily)
MPRTTPWLWFDTEAEEAANFYVGLFPNSRITGVQRYNAAGPRPAGTVMTVEWELDGQQYAGLNGGPDFRFTEAVSFMIDCADQAEVDHYWDAFADGGEPGPCGWIKDRFGLSWQVVPRTLMELLNDPDPKVAEAVMAAMLQMSKIDVAGLEAARDAAA